MKKSYSVRKCSEANAIDADWDKPFWQDIETVEVVLPHWPVQTEHLPKTEVKVQYDAENLYVIFRVQDQYVCAAAKQTHDPVSRDSCVEFFFAPYAGEGTSYFNIEINCCGILLMQHYEGPRMGVRPLDLELCRKIQIATSIQGPIKKEIADPLTWTLEYRLPYETLVGYPEVEIPAPGVQWRANFFKIADESSHPHWITWSPIERDQTDFHRPEYFGVLKFV